ncbi:MAG: metallophosphoesterase, partial [Candidatus Hydrothermales bacterium]
MQYYIFSDFHLGVSEERDKKVFEKFFSILEKLEKGTKIVFLGDIFDFWFEYKTVLPKENFLFVSELYKFKDKFEFLYFTGNHDFFVRNFVQGFNMRIFQRERIFQIGEKKVLFSHGDFYYQSDLIGTYFNYLVRSSFVKFLFYILHPDIGIKLAKSISKISRNTSEKKEPKEEIPERVKKFFKKGGDICILGHFHKPMFIEMDQK